MGHSGVKSFRMETLKKPACILQHIEETELGWVTQR